MRILLTIFIAALGAACAAAQDPAPVPSQVAVGKKAFISNASGESILPAGVGDGTYNQFYASMKNWGRYELVSAPSDADLVFEIRYELPFGPVNVSSGNGGSGQYPQLRLSILDPKTRIVLWAFTEPVQQVRKKSTGLENFQGAMDKLLGDVKALAAAPAAPSTATPS